MISSRIPPELLPESDDRTSPLAGLPLAMGASLLFWVPLLAVWLW